MFSLLRSMENSSSQELLVRLSRMVENDRLIELVSVTTCKCIPGEYKGKMSNGVQQWCQGGDGPLQCQGVRAMPKGD